MHQRPSLLQIRAERDRFAASYSNAALLQVELAERLMERLDYVRLNPAKLLELDAAAGQLTQLLMKRYPAAEVYACDASLPLLLQQPVHEHLNLVISEQESLALASETMDLVVSNLSLAWLSDPKCCFQEVNRVLKPGGLFLFTSLGPDTLQELRYSFQALDNDAHVYEFMDMHHVGDALLETGWEDPVMDREVLTMSYENLSDLFADIRVAGGKNLLPARSPFLMSKGRWKMMQEGYEQLRMEDQQLPATFEIIYGHAWKKQNMSNAYSNEQGEIFISVDSIKRKGG